MPRIVPPQPTAPIVDDQGRMTPEFMLWTQLVSGQSFLTGSGSPEGVEAATVTRVYMDTDGTAESILYVKRDAAIAGDETRGWILV